MQQNQVVEYQEKKEGSFREKFMKVMRNKVVLAIASIVFGLVLIVWQRSAVETLVSIMGIIFLACAAVFIIMFAVQKEKKGGLLVTGIILAIFGAFFLINPDFVVKLFPVIMGIILVISGLFDMVNAFKLPKTVGSRTGIIVVSIIITALGVLCMFQPGIIADILMVFIGIMLLFNGVFDLVVMAMGSVHKNKNPNEIVQ